MKSLLDPSFRYTPSYGTDIRKTFERIRRERDAEKPLQPQAGENVLRLESRKAGSK